MDDTYPRQTSNEKNMPPNAEAVRVDMDLEKWNERIEALMEQKARIIAFRGAGTVNGIEAGAAEKAAALLSEYVEQVTADGTPVALLFDGDEDNRQKPDIGSVFGSLADTLSDNPHVVAIAAQTKGWYSPKAENGAIENASGKPYETYVFPDELPGSHASLTQSQTLATYPNYEQVFVGPAGPIAFNQLQDLNNKTASRPAEAGPVKVTVLETANNPALEPELAAQLDAASDDETKHAKIQAKITQRQEQPYGALFTKDGEFNVDPGQYPNIAFTVTSVS